MKYDPSASRVVYPDSRVPPYQPQLSDAEMGAIIHRNQPWKDHEEVMSDVRYEQLRQRLWNGG